MPAKPFAVCDSETDPFKKDRIPQPFLWGYYDGKKFRHWRDTKEFVDFVKPLRIILYAHNGGKFDFMYLLKYLEETRAQIINGRIVSLYLGACELRDSFAAIPEALEKFGGKKQIDYDKLEEHCREDHMAEIIDYCYHDCKSLYDTLKIYRAIAGKQKTIASNALQFARKAGMNPGKTNHRFDEKYRLFYFGGRTECFQPGTHNDIRIFDLNSAYPFAMTHDHATGNEFVRWGDIKDLTHAQLERAFIVLNCFAKGAFPKRVIGPQGGLSFPHEYGEYHVTGWEYLVAKEFNLIDDEEITSVRVAEKTISFKDYVDHWFAYKKQYSERLDNGELKYPIEYTVGKTMQNSLYGKLSQNPARYYDYRYLPAGTKICPFELDSEMIDQDICGLCGKKGKEHGWQLHCEFEGHEIHRREAIHKYKYDLGAQWVGKPIYNNVATGASITGFTRAHLLRAIHTVGIGNVIYCDTDSMFVKAGADISGLSISNKLGDWKLEGSATVGHFAGKKLYGVDLGAHRDPQKRYKIASKGSKLTYDNILDIISGKTVKWENKAPTFHIDGSADFVVRDIRATGMLKPS